MIRKPIVAGRFYEDNKNSLLKEIKTSFLSKFGPGSFPEKRNESLQIKGIISPHAGYFFSGAAAAFAYKHIAESKFCDTYIILGLSHEGFDSCVSFDDFETPLGIIKNEIELTKKIMNYADIKENRQAHAHEHSIEVQLPFLQFATEDHANDLKFCPIIVGNDKKYKQIGAAIKKVISESKKSICIIASSDFTHYGPNYGYLPFSMNVRDDLYKLDKKAISFILKHDSKGFLDFIDDTGATICGKYPIATLLESLDFKKGELLKYYNSGDIVNDFSNSVGYASIIFK